jgi:aryl-alcohol dehydrogenase-like predicted oxidoreductase
VHALAGARNAEQAQANAQAAQVQLSPAELDEIDAIGRQVSDRLEGTPIMWDFAA